MSKLRIWLEFIDAKTGSPREVELSGTTLTLGRTGGELKIDDGALSEIHAIISQERGLIIIRDLNSKNGTFLNNNKIVEAQLTNLDEIRIGNTRLTFHAAYVANTELPPAPGHHQAMHSGGKTLNPIQLLLHPLRFWPPALESGVFQLRRTWLIHLLTFAILIATGLATGGALPFLHLGFLLLAATVALALIAMTCSVFFAFDSMPDAPHRLSQSMRFTFCLSPFLMLFQGAFLVWMAKTHLRPSHYFIAGMVPTMCFWSLVGTQSRHAFAASFARAMSFAVTASVPWNLFMTGLMSFMI